MVLLAWWAGRERASEGRALLLETILKFSVCWAAGTWYADVRVVRVEVTQLHGVLHAAALSAVAVHFDEPGPGGGERPVSIVRSVWATLLSNTLRFINYHIIIYIMYQVKFKFRFFADHHFTNLLTKLQVLWWKKELQFNYSQGREEQPFTTVCAHITESARETNQSENNQAVLLTASFR